MSLLPDLVLAAKVGLSALPAAKLGMGVIFVFFPMLKMAELLISLLVIGAKFATAFRWKIFPSIVMIQVVGAFSGSVVNISLSLKQSTML